MRSLVGLGSLSAIIFWIVIGHPANATQSEFDRGFDGFPTRSAGGASDCANSTNRISPTGPKWGFSSRPLQPNSAAQKIRIFRQLTHVLRLRKGEKFRQTPTIVVSLSSNPVSRIFWIYKFQSISLHFGVHCIDRFSSTQQLPIRRHAAAWASTAMYRPRVVYCFEH